MKTSSINSWINWKARNCDGKFTLRQYVKLSNPNAAFGRLDGWDNQVNKFESSFMKVKLSCWYPRQWSSEDLEIYSSATAGKSKTKW